MLLLFWDTRPVTIDKSLAKELNGIIRKVIRLYTSKGIKIILTDLDNTLISYDESKPTKEIFELKDKILNLGLDLMVVSNSKQKRVKPFLI